MNAAEAEFIGPTPALARKAELLHRLHAPDVCLGLDTIRFIASALEKWLAPHRKQAREEERFAFRGIDCW